MDTTGISERHVSQHYLSERGERAMCLFTPITMVSNTKNPKRLLQETLAL